MAEKQRNGRDRHRNREMAEIDKETEKLKRQTQKQRNDRNRHRAREITEIDRTQRNYRYRHRNR